MDEYNIEQLLKKINVLETELKASKNMVWFGIKKIQKKTL